MMATKDRASIIALIKLQQTVKMFGLEFMTAISKNIVIETK